MNGIDGSTAATLIAAGEGWLWLGGLTAAAFLLFGLDRLEPSARGAYAFRALIVPGLVLLWPLVLWRWWVLARRAWDEQQRHAPPLPLQGRAALALAAAVPAILVAALAVRQPEPAPRAPVPLAPPAAGANSR
ncbi:MAG: hypothetical protein AAF677_15800 [Pseudomonadota bacterium]